MALTKSQCGVWGLLWRLGAVIGLMAPIAMAIGPVKADSRPPRMVFGEPGFVDTAAPPSPDDQHARRRAEPAFTSAPAPTRTSARRATDTIIERTAITASCRKAVKAAELKHGIPAGLLLAIAGVEAGHPYALNIDGRAEFPADLLSAAKRVHAAAASGARSIDGGCMQISIPWHRQSLPSLVELFDPAWNADYAGAFLRQLAHETGSWQKAVGRYHSADPSRAIPYIANVADRYPDFRRLPAVQR